MTPFYPIRGSVKLYRRYSEPTVHGLLLFPSYSVLYVQYTEKEVGYLCMMGTTFNCEGCPWGHLDMEGEYIIDPSSTSTVVKVKSVVEMVRKRIGVSNG